ncbi:MAG: coenzyme F420-0:L-glutamate ligase [Anaerolineae bacterium]|nr:coenzyme F420-0:L-glutamate ligase [Anaerolineae bacterium]MCO5191158.1 coenzyme F420-0:L-glutamate ligase [Anaerolineae bacterium]MCO5194896.1 coenzyme F420-0:L-glutamate ligase [Anaerolineae bacterium]MCO5199244.1 coenzyme F420-0:L-glutamate ligase [Anaerolineae bacterium]MCO5207747.1 coenzyme F420-0:L-glutamate ligase [Anaerolineae bacterium]
MTDFAQTRQAVVLIVVPDMPDIQSEDDVAHIIADRLRAADLMLQPGDVIAVAQKIVSKAEGRFVDLTSVQPDSAAVEVAQQTEKDPRLVQVILDESDEISRMAPGVLVVRHKLGFVSANAGIDRSNTGQNDENVVLLLPVAPDISAEKIRQSLQTAFGVPVGVVITDSHGRPHRLGTLGVAIGVAGIPALWDRRGEPDRYGRILQHTDVGVADEIAAAAGLLMGQGAEGSPVVLLRGLQLPQDDGKAGDLIRPKAKDLYR